MRSCSPLNPHATGVKHNWPEKWTKAGFDKNKGVIKEKYCRRCKKLQRKFGD